MVARVVPIEPSAEGNEATRRTSEATSRSFEGDKEIFEHDKARNERNVPGLFVDSERNDVESDADEPTK